MPRKKKADTSVGVPTPAPASTPPAKAEESKPDPSQGSAAGATRDDAVVPPAMADVLSQLTALVKEQRAALDMQKQVNQSLESRLQAQAQEMADIRAISGASQLRPVDANPDVDEQHCYVRIKPCNPKKGYKRANMFLTDRQLGINQLFQGGSGRPGEIPKWYPFSIDDMEKLQRGLAKYRQDPHKPDSLPVFDVVDPETRMEIDRAEETLRMSMIGVGSPEQITPEGIRARTVSGGNGMASSTQPTVEPPSMMEGAQAFKGRAAAAFDGIPASPKKAMRVHDAEPAEVQDMTAVARERMDARPDLQQAKEFAQANPMKSGRV